MSQTILGTGLLLGLAFGAWGSPACTNQTLDNYIALGAGGCEMNGLLFNNFAYSYTMGVDSFYVSGVTGTGTVQDASVVNVGVVNANTAFNFGAQWTVNHYQTASLNLSYNVSAPTTQILSLQNAFTTTQNGIQNGGPSSSMAAVCTGGSCAPTAFTNGIVAIAPTHGPLLITHTFDMNANGSSLATINRMHLLTVCDQFTTTPEPASYGMLGLGIVGLAFARRRRR